MHASDPSPTPPRPASHWQRIGPSVTLLLLSPIISEVLYGATRLSVIFVLIPEIMTWGCAALLIREYVWRWKKRWPSLLLMGLALAVAEECIIQQTSIAPLVSSAQHAYGRAWGVNWIYLLWALGYESVWVVLVPVQLTALLFPHRRDQCWLRTRGLVIAGVVFVIGAFMAWYSWTQQARVIIFHLPPYTPPPLYLLVAAAVILLLIVAAYALPVRAPEGSLAGSQSTPSPWVVALVICVLGTPWGACALLGFGSVPTIPFVPVLAAGCAWASLTFFLVRRWTSSPNWRDFHRFALVLGGVLACMLGGFVVFKVGGALRVDWIGKLVMNVAAAAWLLSVGRSVAHRERG